VGNTEATAEFFKMAIAAEEAAEELYFGFG
jgi:hypothetical protein